MCKNVSYCTMSDLIILPIGMGVLKEFPQGNKQSIFPPHRAQYEQKCISDQRQDKNVRYSYTRSLTCLQSG